MHRIAGVFPLALLIAACAHGSDGPHAETAPIGCSSKQSLNAWDHGQQAERQALQKVGACFPISAQWQLLQSDERSSDFSVVKFKDPATGQSRTAWTHEQYGDD